MAREPLRTTLADDYGEQHEYFTIQHPGTEGLRLQNRLQRALVPALGAINARSLKTLTSDAEGSTDADVMAAGLQALQGAFAEVVTLLEPDTLKSLLKHTTRDGKPLSSDVVFDMAYQGNYGELYAACWYVARHNFGALLQRLMGNVQLAGVTDILRRVTEQVGKLKG